MMSYLCENEAEAYKMVMAMLLKRMQNAKKAQQDNGQCLPD